MLEIKIDNLKVQTPLTASPVRRLRLRAVANSKDNLSFATKQESREQTKATENKQSCENIARKTGNMCQFCTPKIQNTQVLENLSADVLDSNNNNNNIENNNNKTDKSNDILPTDNTEGLKWKHNSLPRKSKVSLPAIPKAAPHEAKMPRKTQRSVSIHAGVLPTPDSNILRDCNSGKMYKRGRLLGKGGFARVYEGTELGSNRKVAMKIIDKSRVVRSPQKEKVNLEIELHQLLATGHPNIVHFENSFENGKYICLILELCAKKSVAQYLRNKDFMSEREVSDILYGIIAGVGHLHNSGIIHRDLKLGNILLSDNMVVKVGDFGLATRSAWAKKRTICGTPNFIAPEVLLRQGHGPESDIWAMGCIMYTLLVGKPPFEATSLGDTYRRILKNKFRIPTTVSPEASDLIKCMLRAKPHTRPTVFELTKHQFFTKNETQLRFPSVEGLVKKFAPDIPSEVVMRHPSLGHHRGSTPSILSTGGVKTPRHVSCPTSCYYFDSSSNSSSYHQRKQSEQQTSSLQQTEDLSQHQTMVSNHTSSCLNLETNLPADNTTQVESKAVSSEAIEAQVPARVDKPQNINICRRNTVAVPREHQPRVEKKTAAWKLLQKCVTPSKKEKKIVESPMKKLANQIQKLMTKSPKKFIDSPATLENEVQHVQVEDELSDKQKPTWITKWVDYSNRYGFGYQLDDGRICVLFNDGAHIALLPDGTTAEYIDANNSPAVQFQIDAPSPIYARVAKILIHFVTYMKNNLVEAQKPAEQVSNTRLVTWSRTNLFVAMYLSDGTLQVNFSKDHVKINISSIASDRDLTITYVNEERERKMYNKKDLVQLAAQTDIVDRLALVHDEFHLLMADAACSSHPFCKVYRYLTNTQPKAAVVCHNNLAIPTEVIAN